MVLGRLLLLSELDHDIVLNLVGDGSISPFLNR